MKKGSKTIITLMLITITLSTIILLNKKEEKVIANKDKNNNFIGMMIEQKDGTYKEKTDINFVSDGYLFNPQKSGCENGGTIFWNKDKSKVEVSLLTSDKCYAYFDIYSYEKYCNYGYENSLACEIVKKKDKSLIYHDGQPDYPEMKNSNLEAGDLSYRYTGGNNIVLNNYICLDNNKSGICSIDDTYRIIGLFKNDEDKYEVKVVKADYTTQEQTGDSTIGAGNTILSKSDYPNYQGKVEQVAGYVWNRFQNNSGTNFNNWKDSNLNKINLNTYFYNYLINKNPNLNYYIANHVWNVGGKGYNDIPGATPQVAYENELGKNRLKEGDSGCYDSDGTDKICAKEDVIYPFTPNNNQESRIGLLYLSDYGYGAYPEAWTYKLYTKDYSGGGYNKEDIVQNNWMYMGINEWPISKCNDWNVGMLVIYKSGNCGSLSMTYIYAIRPVFYLKNNVKILSGTGLISEPYRITM